MLSAVLAVPRSCFLSVVGLVLTSVVTVAASDGPALRTALGDLHTGTGWEGLQVGGLLPVPGSATCQVAAPGGTWVKHGFRTSYAGAQDWNEAAGLRLEVELADATPVTLAVEVLPPAARPGSRGVKATVTLLSLIHI